MANINSYYLYQKYEKRGDQPWIPLDVYSIDGDGTMPLVVKQLNDQACVPTYRTTSGAPYCVNFDKYVDVTTEETFDDGVTWEFVSSSSTLVEADSEDCGYEVCNCDSFAFEGVEETSTAMKTYRLEIPSGQTAVTASTWNSSCGTVPQDFTHTDDSGFTEIVTDGHWAFTDNIIRFTASTNPTNAVREGYMTITYKVNGSSCEKRTHLVQAAGSGSTPSYDFKLAIDVPQGKTSPVIQFYTADGTYMGGYGRVTTDSEVEITWQGSGTITKMTFAENGSYLSAVTVHGYAGITLINNQPLNSGSVTTIDLTQSFNTSDYSGNNRTISVSFSE